MLFVFQVISAFIFALGITAIALSFVCLNASGLDPLGLSITALGCVVSIGAGYCFFKNSKRKTDNDLLADLENKFPLQATTVS